MNLLTHADWYAEYYTNQEYGLLFWHCDEMNDCWDLAWLRARDYSYELRKQNVVIVTWKNFISNIAT